MLLRDLQTLAADAEVQIAAYPPGLPVADDLANDFDQHLGTAQQDIGSDMISQGAYDACHRVDVLLTVMSDRKQPDLWTNEALLGLAEWQEVRRLAKEALQSLGYDLEPPPPGSR